MWLLIDYVSGELKHIEIHTFATEKEAQIKLRELLDPYIVHDDEPENTWQNAQTDCEMSLLPRRYHAIHFNVPLQSLQ